eukprot:9439360-Heterocapsa_arctica.AAC.1
MPQPPTPAKSRTSAVSSSRSSAVSTLQRCSDGRAILPPRQPRRQYSTSRRLCQSGRSHFKALASTLGSTLRYWIASPDPSPATCQ